MLVLSRRAKQTISFPETGISIQFLRIQSGTVKVGIEAPQKVQILREELDAEAAKEADQVRKDSVTLPSDVRHSVRNELHAATLGLHLYREQIQRGLTDDAEATFESILGALKSLDNNRAFQPPGYSSHDEATVDEATVDETTVEGTAANS